jgi:transcriptional antiterminator
MILINHADEKITMTKLSNVLGCSTRTIYRNMSNELKKEKELLNQQI